MNNTEVIEKSLQNRAIDLLLQSLSNREDSRSKRSLIEEAIGLIKKIPS